MSKYEHLDNLAREARAAMGRGQETCQALVPVDPQVKIAALGTYRRA